ncbi:MAG: purine-binding chemotaxis protein CheW [Spirochaetes bacterium]|nr:purine-binding chemotaxis protein CheW [Spirochaetota bacterium]
MEAAAESKGTIRKSFTSYLNFSVGKQLYAVEISGVREVLEYRQIFHLTRIPMINDAIIGVINIRGEIIPIIDLSMRLNNEKMILNPNSGIIIVELDDNGQRVIVGITADRVMGVSRISDDDIVSKPGFGSKIRNDFIENFAMIGDGHVILLRINSLLDFDELSELSGFSIKDLMSIKAAQEDEFSLSGRMYEEETHNKTDEIHYVTLLIEDELYGLQMSRVKEIIRITDMRAVPNSKPFMKGVINIRGRIVPVIDMRERCGLEPKEYQRRTSILIVDVNDVYIGLIVDIVNKVVKIPADSFQYPPHYSSKIDTDFLDGISQINDKIIINLNIDKILSPEEYDYIAKTNFSENIKKEKSDK